MVEKTWKAKVDSLLNTNQIQLSRKEEEYGRYYYEYSSSFFKGNDSIPIVYMFNDDGFNFGKLRKVSIFFEKHDQSKGITKALATLHDLKDTTTKKSKYDTITYTGLNPKTLNRVFQKYFHQYGKPDSLFVDGSYWDNQPISELIDKTFRFKWNSNWGFDGANYHFFVKDLIEQKGNDIIFHSLNFLWNKNNYSISLELPDPVKVNVINSKQDTLIYTMVEIQYKIKDYKKMYFAIVDSLRNKCNLNDIISANTKLLFENLNPYNNNGYNKKMILLVNGFDRGCMEEDRSISSVRYKVKVVDQFNDLLYSTEPLVYSFQKPWPLFVSFNSRFSLDGPIYRQAVSPSYNNGMIVNDGRVVEYNDQAQAELVRNIEFIRKHKEDITVNSQTLAIAFEDGTVRK